MDGDNVELNSETGNLTIDGLSYDYTGDYTCMAMTGAGTDNVTHTVTVSGEHPLLSQLEWVWDWTVVEVCV